MNPFSEYQQETKGPWKLAAMASSQQFPLQSALNTTYRLSHCNNPMSIAMPIQRPGFHPWECAGMPNEMQPYRQAQEHAGKTTRIRRHYAAHNARSPQLETARN